ncbi:MAG: CopG family ribbon-helix-helix protein [Magnetococcus sp. DMHC-1]|nr:CopG family ribbon-helix-helix protein [Magnetococcales bacterium]
MSGNASLTLMLDSDLKDRLEQLAINTQRNVSCLAEEAIKGYVDQNIWIMQETKKAVEQADQGGPFVSHDDMRKWLESWGTKDEIPAPDVPTV